MTETIKVGSRTSKLAMVQTNMVINKLRQINKDIKFEILGINTKGDQIHHKPLRDVFEDGKGAFTSELQQAIKRGEIDMAVHSMKDVAGNLREDKLIFGAFLERESPADLLILKTKEYNSIEELPVDFVIGTVSARRKAFMLRINPALSVKTLRGNVQTRIEKLKGTHKWTEHKPVIYDGILMAESAITRCKDTLDLKDLHYFKIPMDQFLPAAGQGTIGVECRRDDKKIYELLRRINHKETEITTIAEREFLYELGGNCHTVIGTYANLQHGKIKLTAEISDESGNNYYKIENTSEKNPEKLGTETAIKLKRHIADTQGEESLYTIMNLKRK